MEKFDRELQKQILMLCVSAYPKYLGETDYDASIAFTTPAKKLYANLAYLQEHGLISIAAQSTDDEYDILDHVKATCGGIDFMLNDGGLTSVLNIQTIKLHHDTVVVLEDLIAISKIPEPEKARIVSKLRELPADAIKHLTLQLLSQGVQHIPNALQLIQKALAAG